MNIRLIFVLLIGLGGSASPTLAQVSSANAAPAAPQAPGRLDPVPLAGLSVMLSPEERRAIQAVMSGEKSLEAVLPSKPASFSEKTDSQPAPLTPVYLGGIYYVGPNQWTIWLNNRRIESSVVDSEFSVVEIATRGVRVNWTPKDRPETFNFILRPRQTFDPAANRVLEGDTRRPLALRQEAAAK